MLENPEVSTATPFNLRFFFLSVVNSARAPCRAHAASSPEELLGYIKVELSVRELCAKHKQALHKGRVLSPPPPPTSRQTLVPAYIPSGSLRSRPLAGWDEGGRVLRIEIVAKGFERLYRGFNVCVEVVSSFLIKERSER